MANLVQTYGSQQRLMNNQRYTVSFELNGASKKFSFTSRYSPLYSTVKVLRSDFPELFEELSDETLNFQLWMTSMIVDEILGMQTTTGGSTLTDSQVNFVKRQYVRYKTEYEIVRNILVSTAQQGGAQEKHLGEFKITKEVNIFDAQAILDMLKDEMKKYESMLNMRLDVTSAVRAGANFPYPLNARVSF